MAVPGFRKTLKAKKMVVSKPRVARLMKLAQIRAKMKRRFKATTDSKHNYAVNENLLDRNLQLPPQPRHGYRISLIRTIAGWLYLTVVLDLADRKVVGWGKRHVRKLWYIFQNRYGSNIGTDLNTDHRQAQF